MNAARDGLPPVVGPGARALVLGSFPSEASLALSGYYAHPRNQFWSILSLAWGESAPSGVRERQAWALSRGLAIWDCLSACERKGSLDGDIRRPEPNGLEGFLCSWPGISRVLLNGSAAGRYFRAAFGLTADGRELQLAAGRRIGLFFLPSTSPVPSRAFKRVEDKLPAWLPALLF